MKILIVGGGGREHALAWKIKQSPLCEELFVAPGNGGTADIAANVDVKATDISGIKEACANLAIDLCIIAPDDPLAMGMADELALDPRLSKMAVLGPVKAGAKLESSKAFAKEFMEKYGIPTASSATFTALQTEQATAYTHTLALPIVIKADGLAAGKGVVICKSHEEAARELNDMLHNNKFGEAGNTVVIEEFLTGIECSIFVLTDGRGYIELPVAKDYKRVFDNDQGLNTGGMGTVSPVPFADEAFMAKFRERILLPTMEGLKKESIDYRGFIFFGLMNVNGNPYVIEYNARLGDPETQVILPRIEEDLLPLILKAAQGKLDETRQVATRPESAVAVIDVSEGYPGKYSTGFPITLPPTGENVLIFEAGTKSQTDSTEKTTAGGRVLAVVGLGANLAEARKIAYAAEAHVIFENKFRRSDIGLDLLKAN